MLTDLMIMKEMLEPYLLPELEAIVDDSLGFKIKVFGSYLVEDDPFNLNYHELNFKVKLWIIFLS